MAAAKKSAKKSAKKAGKKSSDGFSAAERAAMKERAAELKAEARANKKREDGERDVFDKIAEMPKPDAAIAKRLHEIVTATAPDLMPRTWYGMPAYAKDGAIVCFFQGAAKFDTRYATLGFNDAAKLDAGTMWPTAFAITAMNDANETKIAALVKKAVR